MKKCFVMYQTGHVLRYLSQFVAGFVVGFLSVWQLTLLTLAVVPLIAIAGGGYAIIMSTVSEKSEAAYADAGKVAEEVCLYIYINKRLRLCQNLFYVFTCDQRFHEKNLHSIRFNTILANTKKNSLAFGYFCL